MKILHVNTYHKGGAAAAAQRIWNAQVDAGMDAHFLTVGGAGVSNKAITLPLHLQLIQSQLPRFEYHLARLVNRSAKPLPQGFFSGVAFNAIQRCKPDLVNLHFVEHNMLSIEQIGRLRQVAKSIVWTLHDMSPITGGFGYRIDRTGLILDKEFTFQDELNSVSEALLWRRARAVASSAVSAIAPSIWLENEAKSSPVFQNQEVFRIPYSIPLDTFRVQDLHNSRAEFSLPGAIPLILYGADGFNSERKGYDLFIDALKYLASFWPQQRLKPAIVTFGGSTSLDLRLPFELFEIGKISDETTLSRLYSACDVFVCPSREDNLPNTVLESLACGTPAVGFAIGGIPDMIVDGISGATVPPFETAKLAEAILRILQSDPGHLRATSRMYAENRYAPGIIANAYREVYEQLLAA